jgi:hypothetical protein
LGAVGCPVAPAARREAVTWLAGHAVALEYADAPATFAPPRADGDAQRPDDAPDGADALNGGAWPPRRRDALRLRIGCARRLHRPPPRAARKPAARC